MGNKPHLELTAVSDTKLSNSTPSSLQTGPSAITGQLRAVADKNFKRADTLKSAIDDPLRFIQNGRPWSDTEKNLLKEAEKDYQEIQAQRPGFEKMLNQIDYLMKEKKSECELLLAGEKFLQDKITECDEEIKNYEEILQSIIKQESKAPEVIEWEKKVREILMGLQTEHLELSLVKKESQALQQKFHETENQFIKEFEGLLEDCIQEEGSSGPQDAQPIVEEMSKIKTSMLGFFKGIGVIFNKGLTSFKQLFSEREILGPVILSV